MRKLVQHASRSLAANAPSLASSARPAQTFAQSICWRCQYREASTPLRNGSRAALSFQGRPICARRSISSSARWMDERDPLSSRPMPMPTPPPASQTAPARQGRVEDTAPEIVSSLEGQERQKEEATTKSAQNDVHDNVSRVPDEHLPSHREKQRWNLSKRLSEAMDELLPKLAVVTQKVNTYTGTDYSGVEALRREIKDQEKLVRARRAAIDTAKHTLDIATSEQASAQKEVVALLERKHSWSAGDLERYMSLIRSEHVNDQAVREAKEAVFTAENALEEARTRLEKRERAQYHEEQIWSDTIRRNSTWVTFGLMGVNIFLLLLSLAILEPWRRRRMVREIKNALEAQKVAMEAVPAAALTPVSTVGPNTINATDAEIDQVVSAEASSHDATTSLSSPNAATEESSKTDTAAPAPLQPVPVAEITPTSVSNPTPENDLPSAIPLPLNPASAPLEENTDSPLQDPLHEAPRSKGSTWHNRATAIAKDIVSDRVISMRRIDYTTAIIQGAAAGAVITAALIGILRPT